MTQFSCDRARKIQEEKLPLPNDRFHVAAEQIQNEHVPDQMPRPVVQEDGGKKLPSVGRMNTAITQAEVLADEAWLVGFEKKLGDKGSDIYADQSEQNYPWPLRPRPGERRGFSAGQAHIMRVSQRKFVVDEFRVTSE